MYRLVFVSGPSFCFLFVRCFLKKRENYNQRKRQKARNDYRSLVHLKFWSFFYNCNANLQISFILFFFQHLLEMLVHLGT